MGLKINGKIRRLPRDPASEDGLVTIDVLAPLLGIHEYTIHKHYASAFVRYRAAQSAAPKLYDLEIVADIVSKASKVEVTVKDLYQLVSKEEGVDLMEAVGVFRSHWSWGYWRRKGLGPRPIRIGGLWRYTRSDVYDWAEYLSRHKLAAYRERSAA